MKKHGHASPYVRILTGLLFLVCLIQSRVIQAANRSALESNAIATHLEKVKEELAPLNFQMTSSFSESAREYCRYYGLDIDDSKHIFGTFSSNNKILAAHVFKPSKTKGTVILVHGYFDHTGTWKHVIINLVKQGYTVGVYDQPGHGLSSGDRASIDDFSVYVSVLEEFLRISRANLPGPFHIVAHSMGCAAAVDYLLNVTKTPLNKVVLIAPLIHSAHWYLSTLGHALTGFMINSVPRVFRRNSSDQEFLIFTKRDPLQARHMPMKWFGALVEWNKRVAGYESSRLPVKIIQGTADTTVDWKYNMKFIKKKFVNTDISMIANGGHQLINESLPMRAEVLTLIVDYLEGKTGK
ncbi:MAG: alpha/beta hydrolase [Desulfobacterales bacterium]|nr:alpha/beta hydrolase [Desulfobacterales bacterium]